MNKTRKEMNFLIHQIVALSIININRLALCVSIYQPLENFYNPPFYRQETSPFRTDSIETGSLNTLHNMFYPSNSDVFLLIKNLIDSNPTAGVENEKLSTLVPFYKAHLERVLLGLLGKELNQSQDKIVQIIYYLNILKNLDTLKGSLKVNDVSQDEVKKLLDKNLKEKRVLLSKLKNFKADKGLDSQTNSEDDTEAESNDDNNDSDKRPETDED